jgi:hypothetical protein
MFSVRVMRHCYGREPKNGPDPSKVNHYRRIVLRRLCPLLPLGGGRCFRVQARLRRRVGDAELL